MEKVIHTSRSFEEAEEWDLQQYRSMTPEQRLDILQYLREEYYKFKNVDRKGFQRIYRVIRQK